MDINTITNQPASVNMLFVWAFHQKTTGLFSESGSLENGSSFGARFRPMRQKKCFLDVPKRETFCRCAGYYGQKWTTWISPIRKSTEGFTDI
jgi:hypothetical protein